MKTPLFAALLALAASAFADPLVPIPMGPAGAGQCIIGSDGCGAPRGSAMDPVGEAVIVGLGQRAVPSLGGDALEKAAKMIAAQQAAKAPAAEDVAGSATDLVAIGGQIINPGGSAAPFRSATGMSLGAAAAAGEGSSMLPKQATFDTRVDGSAIAAAAPAKATGLSYVHSQKVEAVVGAKTDPFAGDPKLNAGDAEMGAGGTRASSNGAR
ncbi:MAG TPA: hypothetical protein VN915_04920 [Elusimicrobiota bacterium]|nr:hypothetical protein [Elusimicrobiota bacterium]